MNVDEHMSPMQADPSVERFRAFLAKARDISRRAESEASPPPISTSQALNLPDSVPDIRSFELMVNRARPLVIARARAILDRFAPLAARLDRWLVSVDLLDVAGCSTDEDRYTLLLKWALSQSVAPAAALACQNATLAAAGIPVRIEEAMKVKPWLRTQDGIPDLVLHDNDNLIVIEAKTQSREHLVAATDKMQTDAYLPAARLALNVRSDVRGFTVFLTADGSSAANDHAYNLTYSRLAMAFANVLERDSLKDDVRVAYATIITNWIDRADGLGLEIGSACRKTKAWLKASDAELLGDLGALARLESALLLQEIL